MGTEDTSDMIRIQMLGGFSMTIGDRVIRDSDNHSQQLWNLLEYLIAFRSQPVQPQGLTATLWPRDQSSHPSNALKNLVYRIRTMLAGYGVPFAKDLICYEKNIYRWNNAFPCELDTEQFECLCILASDKRQPADYRIALYLQAFALYRGNFLPSSEYREWAVSLTSHYRTLFFKSIYEACGLMETAERFGEMERVCEQAIRIDSFEERAHAYLLKALVQQGKHTRALTHYHSLTDLFYRELGVSLSQETRDLYREIVKTINNVQSDLKIIKEDLNEQQTVPGAYCCAYEVFKCLYRVEARTAVRTGQPVFIGLLTLTDLNQQIPDVLLLGKAMDQLLEIACHSLRKGDVISRFSATQYVIMLPALTYENGRGALTRIEKRFRAGFRFGGVKLHTVLQPLEPVR